MRTDTRVVLLGAAIAACLLGVRIFEGGPSEIPRFLLVISGAFVPYFAALLLLRGQGARLPARWIVPVAILIQLAPYLGRPMWDRDAYRHHWDGRVLAAGINPYRYAPDDFALADLRDEDWERVDYKHVKTCYPPLTEALLGGTYFLDPSPRRVLLLAMGFHLLCLWPLLALLRARGVDERWLAIYAWNPLLADEFAVGGHLDAISVFFLLAALWAVQTKRHWPAGALMGLSVMAKTHMLLAAPIVLAAAGGWSLLGFVLTCAVSIVPFAGVGAGLIEGTLPYARYWENNSGVFAIWQALLGGEAARLITALLCVGLLAYLTLRRGDALRDCAIMLTAALLLGPVFFPWYIAWVLPFACFFRCVTGVAATYLLLAVYLYTYDPALGLAARTWEMVALYAIGLTEWALWRWRSSHTPSRPAGGPG